MTSSILFGSLLLSVLHAVIPNHWLPILAIGKREKWSLPKVMKITIVSALAHVTSTLAIGGLLALLGAKAIDISDYQVSLIAAAILVILGIVYIYRHHRHKHFHINEDVKRKRSDRAIIIALVLAMLLSPCMEIEAYFLLAGTKGWWLVGVIAAMYTIITTTGMLFLVGFAYRHLVKLNWHALEHNAGIITGITLIATGIIMYFIQ